MMYQLDFQEPKHIHFIGIGGISMSGLAEILLQAGFVVSGSDMRRSAMTDHLQEKGILVRIGQRAANITEQVEVVVYTAAIHEDNEEYQAALQRGLPLLSRAQLLGQLMRNYGEAIAIAGTHGKTTTTSMVSEICMAAELDPTITVGGILPSIGGNIRIGSSACFITEACEYTNSFHSFFPTKAVILNVREDHTDFFHGIEEVRASFRRFASLLPETGLLVINGEIPDWRELTEGVRAQIVTVGLTGTELDFTAGEIEYDERACASFEVYRRGEPYGRFSLNIPGEHNVSNALAAIALAQELGATPAQIQTGLSRYTGTERRFEKKGEIGGVRIFDDYAHHPDEIRATLQMAKRLPAGKLWCVFQPHTYTRTQAFLDEFADALSLADEVVLADIYAAREVNTSGISSEDIRTRIEKNGVSARHFSSFGEIVDFLLTHCVHGDMLITMGAGDIVKVGEMLLGH